MRTLPRLLSLLSLFALTLTACGSDDGTPPAEVSITVSPTSASVFVGETVQLSASVTGATGADVTWSASPSGIVSVDGSGLVAGVGLGTATVTATVQGEGVSATAQVTVEASTIAVTPAEVEVGVDETVQLTATITGGVGLTTSWESGDEGIATVDGSGLVTGVGGGTVDITASVDGQPGVSDAASVTVTAPPPEVVAAQILDADGQEADLGNVVDLLDLVFTVEGEVGSGGRIDVLIDGEVLASEEFTLEAPALAQTSRRGPRQIPTSQQVRVEVPLAMVSVVGADIIERHPKGDYDLEAILATLPEVQTIPLRGENSLSITTNPSPKLWIRGVDPGGTVLTINGRTIHDGDLGLDMSLVPQGAIERVEILTDGASAIYGDQAVGGAVNLIIPSADRQGYEGPTTFTSVQGFDATDQPVDLTLGTQDLVLTGQLPFVLDFDGRAPQYSAPFQVSENFAMSAAYNLAEFKAITGYDESNWTDYSGFGTPRLDFGTTLSMWEITDFQTGTELEGFDGRELFVRTHATDPFGHSMEKVLQGLSGPARVGIDNTPIVLGTRSDPWAIQDFQLGIGVDQRYGLTAFDPPGQFGSYSSGVASGPLGLKIQRQWPDGSSYVVGGADHFEDAPGALNGGLPFDFASQGAGEYWATFRGQDNTGTVTDLTLRNTYESNDPVVNDFTVAGSFDAGSLLTYGATFSADLELQAVAFGVHYPGVANGEGVYYIGWNEMVGSPFDGTWAGDRTVDGLEYGPFWPNVQTTGSTFPFTANQVYTADFGFAGALSTGGRYGVATYNFSGLPGMGGSWADLGEDNTEDYEGPDHLCNASLVEDCQGVPESGIYSAGAFTSGEFSSGWAQLHVRKRLPDGRLLSLPVAEPVQGTVTDHGSFLEKYWSSPVNATELNLGPEVDRIYWVMFPAEGSGLNGSLWTYGKNLQIGF